MTALLCIGLELAFHVVHVYVFSIPCWGLSLLALPAVGSPYVRLQQADLSPIAYANYVC